jgi:hypothetical protein
MVKIKYIKKLVFFLVIFIYGCSEQYKFTDKENLNKILNDLSNGDFYSCNFERVIEQKNFNFKPNRNINLIYTDKIIGLIYKNDKWNHGNSIFKKKINSEYEYILGSFYSGTDFNENEEQDMTILKFDGKTLQVNLFDENRYSSYNCKHLKELISEAMKKQILKNFLLQRNEDRY